MLALVEEDKKSPHVASVIVEEGLEWYSAQNKYTPFDLISLSF